MKLFLWIVIYNAGLVAGNVGPLPADVTYFQCMEIAVSDTATLASNGHPEITMDCEHRASRPVIELPGKVCRNINTDREVCE